MQLSPRYGHRPILVIDLPIQVEHPAMGQRRRLGEVLATFSDDDWGHPSRCEGWSVQDVVAHLASTNDFWAYSIRSGAAGAPTELLATFDPVATPAQLAERERGRPPAEILEAGLLLIVRTHRLTFHFTSRAICQPPGIEVTFVRAATNGA